MTACDILAWIVLIILLAVLVLLVWLMGSTQGHLARRRGHPWAEALGVSLDVPAVAKMLPAGATGTAAIFTDHAKASHMIRRVLLRQVAILDYINPF